VSVQGTFENLDLQLEEDGETTSWAIHNGGRLSDEQSHAIHHSQELLVA
jgi:hypothetical protein